MVGLGAHQGDLLHALRDLRSTGARVRQLFLDAATDVLVRRYEGTRRRHPLADAGEGLADAIERERALLEPVKAEADVVVDTSALNVHELHARMRRPLRRGRRRPRPCRPGSCPSGTSTACPSTSTSCSTAASCPTLTGSTSCARFTGLDEPVRRYVLDQEAARDLLTRLDDLLGMLLPAYVAEGKSYLTLAFGCTGGRHRSVAIAEEVARLLERRAFAPTVVHRDIAK